MPSTNKTPNLQLNNWVGSDRPKREDFNSDNTKIDTAYKSLLDKMAGIGGFEKRTYAELYEMRRNDQLVEGRRYLLTDYATKYIQPTTNALKEMAVEPLILTASSKGNFETIAFSPKYSNDIIWYEFYNNQCEDGKTPRNGFIARRFDTSSKNDAPQDWRSMVWARWTPHPTQYYLNGTLKDYSVWTSGAAKLGEVYKADRKLWMAKNTNVPIDETDTNVFYQVYYDISVPLLVNEKTTIAKGVELFRGTFNEVPTFGYECHSNTIKTIENRTLHNNVFIDTCYSNTLDSSCYANSFGYSCRYNSFGNSCYSNVLGNSCYGNSFGNGCYGNVLGYSCYYNSFGNSCYSNRLGNNNRNNSLGISCSSNYFPYDCYGNNFGYSCVNNSFGNACLNNLFGNACQNNTFDTNCSRNWFGNNCTVNTFATSCVSNILGNFCQSNQLGMSCSNNSFGNSCIGNKLTSSCSNNSFGNGCDNNKLDDSCIANSFDNDCDSNTLGTKCDSNTFGNSCYNNKLGSICYNNTFTGAITANTFGNNFRNNTVKALRSKDISSLGGFLTQENVTTTMERNTQGFYAYWYVTSSGEIAVIELA